MIEEVINEILQAEQRADSIILEARENAKRLLEANAAEISSLYEDAEAKLRHEIESLLANAEKDADVLADSQRAAFRQQVVEAMQKADQRFENAVLRVNKAVQGE